MLLNHHIHTSAPPPPFASQFFTTIFHLLIFCMKTIQPLSLSLSLTPFVSILQSKVRYYYFFFASRFATTFYPHTKNGHRQFNWRWRIFVDFGSSSSTLWIVCVGFTTRTFNNNDIQASFRSNLIRTEKKCERNKSDWDQLFYLIELHFIFFLFCLSFQFEKKIRMEKRNPTPPLGCGHSNSTDDHHSRTRTSYRFQ